MATEHVFIARRPQITEGVRPRRVVEVVDLDSFLYLDNWDKGFLRPVYWGCRVVDKADGARVNLVLSAGDLDQLVKLEKKHSQIDRIRKMVDAAKSLIDKGFVIEYGYCV